MRCRHRQRESRDAAQLKKSKRLSASLTGTIRDGAGTSTALTERVTLTLAKAKRKPKTRH